ncbi:MAG: phosphopentomutase, partial [Erysipelotrichia bacterium]|nr:phosphopentomutase [Erysipelotrichia bacterium]
KLIVYTSADSVLQIAAHEEVIPLEELYRCCRIVREITLQPKWRVGRVIARPFITKDKQYVRTSNRHDYALNPSEATVLDKLNDHHFKVIGIGKINDIFNGCGICELLRSTSSIEGMKQTIQMLSKDFTGLCFTNLVDFDALWGHRRNIEGYRQELERFDSLLGQFIEQLNTEDLLILCADHGNDPSYSGSDHTREYIPLIFYSPSLNGSGLLPIADSFNVVGKTILNNFNINVQDVSSSYLHYLR